MAIVKRKTRKKISKQLNKLVKKHGPEAALAFVTGIVTNMTTDGSKKAEKADKKEKAPAKPAVARQRPLARVER